MSAVSVKFDCIVNMALLNVSLAVPRSDTEYGKNGATPPYNKTRLRLALRSLGLYVL